jgi:hypothetical protein
VGSALLLLLLLRMVMAVCCQAYRHHHHCWGAPPYLRPLLLAPLVVPGAAATRAQLLLGPCLGLQPPQQPERRAPVLAHQRALD